MNIAHRTSCRLWTALILHSESPWLLKTKGCRVKCHVWEKKSQNLWSHWFNNKTIVISLDPRTENSVRISQTTEERCDESCRSVVSDTGAATLTQTLWRSVNFLGWFLIRIRSIPVTILSFRWTDWFFLPDTPVYPAAAVTCWFESASSRPPPCWPLNKQTYISSYFTFISYLDTLNCCLFSDQLRSNALNIHNYRLLKAWPHISPVVRVAEWETGDMQTLFWTLRAHRLPLLCVAVCSTAVTSLLQRKP